MEVERVESCPAGVEGGESAKDDGGGGEAGCIQV
jgi:hypothetical protein